MRIHRFLWMLLAFEINGAASARTPTPKAEVGWIYDGERTCIFDESRSASKPTRCAQYYMQIQRKTEGGSVWTEYRWMWKGGDGLEVHYRSRIGSMGISTFTIGELFDRKSNLPGHMSKNAVSYSPSREELVIGVPGDGYEFSVKGGAL
ncbi:hypothetical protein QH494_03765 [Sphingomonas sp. AR_OL41]|uniref:hypothetical protein n=1 Tax=Sphingomonas sp. AR_OL41 TaxID=3042729 RepID=UPI0024812C75|nr:hypothetical protein [Sphingomonas sp. AR_OL41]MDH7971287.1 hypothetical protein [Sphingomonas sp. AR_OL41]